MRYASVNNVMISALVSQSYKFPTHQAAQNLLEKLKAQFILAKGHEELLPQGKLKLWIRGFQLTEEEIKEGALGNFCIATIVQQNDGNCLIKCEKENTPPINHPMKKRKTARMPNWGHPTMRYIKNGGKFDRYEDAVESLYNLHQEFPDTTIPNKDRLDVMVYTREGKKKPETKKFRLNLKPVENYFVITPEEKVARPRVSETEEKPSDIIGRFTALALMKKKKKK